MTEKRYLKYSLQHLIDHFYTFLKNKINPIVASHSRGVGWSMARPAGRRAVLCQSREEGLLQLAPGTSLILNQVLVPSSGTAPWRGLESQPYSMDSSGEGEGGESI